jgi:transcriptional regulator with XRE-family HTH domain
MGRRNMTRAELARRLNESEMWVGRRLNGHVPITVNDLARMVTVLDVPAANLLVDPS